MSAPDRAVTVGDILPWLAFAAVTGFICWMAGDLTGYRRGRTEGQNDLYEQQCARIGGRVVDGHCYKLEEVKP